MADTTITGSVSTGLTLHGTLGASLDVPTGAVVTGNEISGQMVGGPKGDVGPAGYTPVKGVDYNDGVDGVDGKTILTGVGSPSSGLGSDGDMYIDTSANDIYGPKTGGVWGSGTSLVGSPGISVPSGGTTGQTLLKNSSTDYDYSWATPPTAPVVSVAGKTGAVTLAKADVGLGSADNTSDLNKPISTATQTALDGKVGKVATVNTLYGVNGSGNQASYLISQSSDTSSIAQRSSGGTLTVGTPTASAHATTKAYVDNADTAHTSNTSNPHSVTKAQVGLGSVPNLDTTTAVADSHTHTNKSLLDVLPSSVGSNNQVLKVVSGSPAWSTDSNTTYTGITGSTTTTTTATANLSIDRLTIANYTSGQLMATLPASAAVGSIIEVFGLSSGGFRITAPSGDNILYPDGTDSGSAGYIKATQYTTVTLRCIVASTTWVVTKATKLITNNNAKTMPNPPSW